MTTKQRPTKAHRKRGEGHVRTIMSLSSQDRASLDAIKVAYRERLGFDISHSLVVSIALDALTQEVKSGHLRCHPETYLNH